MGLAMQATTVESGAADGSATVRVTLRPANPGDLMPLHFFFDSLLRRDYFLRRGQLAELLSGRRHRVFVAEIEGVLVGAAVLTCGARLVNALIHPAYRGLNIGRQLVDFCGAREVRAKIDMSTGDPRGFYRKLGFRETGGRNAKGNIALMQKGRGGTRRETV